MDPEDIEWGFVAAGWEVPGASRFPIVGNDGDLSIVCPRLVCSEERRPRLRDSRRKAHVVSLVQEDHHAPAGRGVARRTWRSSRGRTGEPAQTRLEPVLLEQDLGETVLLFVLSNCLTNNLKRTRAPREGSSSSLFLIYRRKAIFPEMSMA